MGKYTHLRHKLPAFEKSPEATGMAAWYKKVDAFKLEFLGTLSGENANSIRLAREYAERDKRKKKLEDADIPQLNIELEAISSLGVEAMESEGIQKVVLADGGYVRIDDKPYPSIKDKSAVLNWFLAQKMFEIVEVSVRGLNKKQLEKLVAWLKKEKMPAMLSVNTNTVQAMARERAAAGQTTIDGVGVPYLKTKLTVRGVRNGNDDSGGDEQ